MNTPMSSKNANPPEHLSRAARRFWRAVQADYELTLRDLKLLTAALEAFDRLNEARTILDADGIVIRSKDGTPRAHPAVAIERDSRLAMVRCLRELDLDGTPLPDPRPARMR